MNCKRHIIAIGVLIAVSGITLIQCASYSSYGSHHSGRRRYKPERPNNTVSSYGDNNSNEFEEVYRWKQMSYGPLDNDSIVRDERPNDLEVSDIQADFVPYNNLPMGVVHHKDRIFITLPRRRLGMPATLTYVRTNGTKGSSPSLQAYPNFRTNELHPQRQPDTNRIVSVYRSRVDSCNRLWFVDTGSLEYPGNTIQVQPPSIWIFDLNTDSLIRRFEIPTNIVTAGHGIASLTVDIDDRCDEAYAYLPDLVNYRLHVYSYRDNSLWSFSHNSLSFDPIGGDFEVNGVQFEWTDGVFSVTLSNRNPDGFKTAFFHAMASTSEFSISTQILRDKTMASRSYHGNDFRYLGKRSAKGQSCMHAYDKDSGVIFYTQVSLNGIGCWNIANPLTESNFHIIAQDNTTMIYPSDLNIDDEGVIWFMTNSLPFYNYASVDPNEYNYRIWKASAREILQNSHCTKMETQQ